MRILQRPASRVDPTSAASPPLNLRAEGSAIDSKPPIARSTDITHTATSVSAKSAPAAVEELLSTGRTVMADVHGNLGPPSVLTDAKAPVEWLTDRWQAAANMQGEPIPGEHWVSIDLGRPCAISRVVLDWETAWSSHWQLQVR